MKNLIKKIYKDVYSAQYQNWENLPQPNRIITKIYNYKSYTLFHSCNTVHGTSGGPIILYNHKVIGIHRGILEHENFKMATLLQYPIKEYCKKLKTNNNKITMTYEVNNNDENIKV